MALAAEMRPQPARSQPVANSSLILVKNHLTGRQEASIGVPFSHDSFAVEGRLCSALLNRSPQADAVCLSDVN